MHVLLEILDLYKPEATLSQSSGFFQYWEMLAKLGKNLNNRIV